VTIATVLAREIITYSDAWKDSKEHTERTTAEEVDYVEEDDCDRRDGVSLTPAADFQRIEDNERNWCLRRRSVLRSCTGIKS